MEGQEGKMSLVRLRMDLAYDGGGFHGWARQPGLRTVQGCIEQALSLITGARSSQGGVPHNHDVWEPRLVVAGRTDTGVHASHQVAHLDIPDGVLESCRGHMEADGVVALERRLRHLLPADIVLLGLGLAPRGFDARFSAMERTYLYRVSQGGQPGDPRMRGYVLDLEGSLDLQAMNEAARACIGLHDFGSFARPNPGGTTIRKVLAAHWDLVPAVNLFGAAPDQSVVGYLPTFMESGLTVFRIVADAFAHNMVRSLVAACIQVGLGRRSVPWFVDKVARPLREGSTGPIDARGLTLEHVAYPPDGQLAERAQAIRARRTL
ncbi:MULTISPECIES: tRNA pseudouridine synthase A [Bifidobacterium]|uniref:tRNA pseudouridine synthase A n=1 Tax=Bifidobacterium apousia TaxID=2750996 RepID=A0A556R5T7_9BIFI|nr:MULTISPECIES: tRNA pseudouridine synthase A [Bifidobacterium]TSJ84254.1 tRNA pseudouridine synthase A [Bifidobacterium apousia]